MNAHAATFAVVFGLHLSVLGLALDAVTGGLTGARPSRVLPRCWARASSTGSVPAGRPRRQPFAWHWRLCA